MIVQREGKVTMKYIETLSNTRNSTVLSNLYYDSRFPSLTRLYTNMYSNPIRGLSSLIHGEGSVANFGKPNVRMIGYESTPGVWLFDDTESGIIWMIYSDCHKKNHFKGTSYEVILPANTTDAQLVQSLTGLFKLIGISIVNENFVIDKKSNELVPNN